ncbi:RDD family protein [Dermatobacter hominis]|uniref:RDD family protein n=1 Tax=Dermatobacter hominis TaxID=2884263 RepID=UPI001D116A0C|nr:RDD family protein [Dermatobacter hominis]UDY35808.1 RDD family protein [Dermatobacter hominis]
MSEPGPPPDEGQDPTTPTPPVPPGSGGPFASPPYGAPPPPGHGAPPQPGQPQYGQPQFGQPEFGQPQFGQPQYGAPPPPGYGPPPGGGFQPPASPYQYGVGLPSNALLASPGKRIGGWLIDWVILVVGLVVVWIIAGVTIAGSSTSQVNEFGLVEDEMTGGGVVAMLLAYALTLLVPILYQIAFVALKGQTPGAMLVKVKVVRLADGQIPGWGSATLRWLPQLAGIACSLITLGLYIWGLVNLFNNDLRQTPFDLAAKTVVIDAA